MVFAFGIAAAAVLTAFYSGFMVSLFRALRPVKNRPSGRKPRMSVIVPAHNEEKTLPGLLKRLSVQHYPGNKTEILLVDDRSSDGTYGVMRRFAGNRSHCRIIRIKDTPEGISPKKHAISLAVASAGGEICLTTDADSRPGPDWIRSVVRTFDPGTGAVIGYAPFRTDGPYSTFFHRLLALDYFSLSAVALGSVQTGRPITCNGANFAYRKKLFKSIGGFGETARTLSGDDDLLLHRFHTVAKARIRYAVDAEAAVFTDPPRDFADFFWQRIRFSSKHLAYPGYALFFLWTVYLYYWMLLLFLFGSFFSRICLAVFLSLLCVKALVEIPFLARAQHLLEKRNLIRFYPAAILLHIPYVVFIPLLARFLKPRWGNSANTGKSKQ